LQGAKKAGRSKTQIYGGLKEFFQSAADGIWERHPDFSKLQVARMISKGIADLAKNWNDNSPLAALASLLSDNDLEANPNTIRRLIRKS